MASAFVEISSESGEATRSLERTTQALVEYRDRCGEISEIRPKLAECKLEYAAESEKIADWLREMSADRSDENQIREAEVQLQNLVTLVENLRDSVSDLRGSGSMPPLTTRNDSIDPTPSFDQPGPEATGFVGEN